MRRHYKLKHPYIFHTETEKSRILWRSKSKTKLSETKARKEKTENKEDPSVDIETTLAKNVTSQVPKKRRSAIWQHFTELEKGFVRCEICCMKLRDKHYIVVLHLNRRHPNTFAALGDFNIMPFRQRSNLLWNFFVKEGNKLVSCLLCGFTMRKNMAKHLQTKHPEDFEQAVSCERKELAKYCEPRPKAPKTWVKKYCVKVADKQFKCNQCNNVLRMPNGFFGNMRRHIRIKHPNIYYGETKAAKEGNTGKCNIGMKEHMIDLLDKDDNSNALSLKDPLADFDLGSPAMSETEVAANFLDNDNLASNVYSGIDLKSIADIPVLERREADNYDKSYFLLLENSQYKCVECEETVNCPNIEEQEALFKHMRDKHPEEIMTLQATSTENDDEYQVVVLGNIDS